MIKKAKQALGNVKRALSTLRHTKFSSSDVYLNCIPYKSVRLFYWRPDDGLINFGDYISKVVVERMLQLNSLTINDGVLTGRKLLSVGSILHYGKTGDVIWGSGVGGRVSDAEYEFKSLDVRAVRGPLTRQFLIGKGIDVPEVFGDPALLLPSLFKGRFGKSPSGKVVVVPNLHDLNLIDLTALKQRNFTVLSPFEPWNVCVETIASAKFVISSSLHGIILADAFGVPARQLRISATENTFKYRDYFMGTGREPPLAASSIDEALEMGCHEKLDFDETALRESFPYDLWVGCDEVLN